MHSLKVVKRCLCSNEETPFGHLKIAKHLGCLHLAAIIAELEQVSPTPLCWWV